MRALIFLTISLLFFTCSDDDFQEFNVSLETCGYYPSPCSLFTPEQYIEISGATPYPTADSYGQVDVPNQGSSDIKICEMGFEDEVGNDHVLYVLLRCVDDLENDEITNLIQVSSYPSFPFNSEAAFEDAIYHPNIDVYVIRKGNYIVELDFQNIEKDKQIEVATLIMNNLP